MKAQSEDRKPYLVNHQTAEDDAVIARAIQILDARFSGRDDVYLNSPQVVKDYLKLKLFSQGHESFYVITTDAQNRLISADELFRGTLTQTSVYPREVVKHCLSKNAAAVILAHNHPSGIADPSRADELLTGTLKSALALVDVKVLDHFVLAGAACMSFAERGLL